MGISLKNKEEYEGKILNNKSGEPFKIISYNSTNNVKIKFLNTNTEYTVTLGNIKKGTVKDLMSPSVYGVGYIGIGKYKSRDNRNPQYASYKRWKEILDRCYNPDCDSYISYGARGVVICEEWKNYQNFAKWYEENCTDETFAIDKDILCKGNKVYCPEYCRFIPKDINSALTSRRRERRDYPVGVRLKDGYIIAQINYMGKKKHLGSFSTVEKAFAAYKVAKEQCLKDYADKYKDVISEDIYNALYEYKIEIDD